MTKTSANEILPLEIFAADNKTIKTALWGRSRIIKACKNGFGTDTEVTGIDKLFTGHPLASGRRTIKMGNWFCIDTGAVIRLSGTTDGITPTCNLHDLHLSLIDIHTTPEEIHRLKPHDDNFPYYVIQARIPAPLLSHLFT